MATYQDILYDVDGPIAYITLNRPEKMNALSNNLRGELVHALKEAEFDPTIRVIVIRGAGRAFSAGYDIGGGRVPLPRAAPTCTPRRGCRTSAPPVPARPSGRTT
mgnify:CR=1 FL=1